ncbi:MAG: metalloendopeptidase-like membrane protein [Elusimicrobia bacterium]|nr:MAG: metalloendopeptidase-like membrane protein [Elusimicrobiota bacterium]KAF0154416.1 MAG: metalloendopeptidase-like membrane protein [Elusimicrobiota bacterium]
MNFRRAILPAAAAGLLTTGVISVASVPRQDPPDYARFSVLTPAGPAAPEPEVFKALDRVVHARHRIGPSETIGAIAALYGTDVKALRSTNHNEFIFMRRGGHIRVHNGNGYLHEVTQDGETLNGVTSRYRRSGPDHGGLRADVVRVNRLPPSSLVSNYTFKKGDRVLLPGVYLDLDTYRIPLPYFSRISSRHGNRRHPIYKKVMFHSGIDIPMPTGTPVYPSRSGTVAFAGWMGGYGNVVDVRHSDGYTTRYGHLSKITVKAGEQVQKGRTMVGRVGSTGVSTGPHLHFEILTNTGRSVNPTAKFGRK